MKVVIVGATGLVGSHFTQLLHKQNVDKIILITRKEVPHFNQKNVEQIILPDMSPDNIRNLEIEAEVYFCSLGTTIKTAGSKEKFRNVDFNLVIAFADLAKKNAKCFIVISAYGANSTSSIFYNQVKREMEEYLESLDFPSLYIFQPSLLIAEREEKRLAEDLAIKSFHLFEKILPKKLSLMLGTKVPKLVTKSYEAAKDKKPGTHRITPTLI